jgi:hypothetical protein
VTNEASSRERPKEMSGLAERGQNNNMDTSEAESALVSSGLRRSFASVSVAVFVAVLTTFVLGRRRPYGAARCASELRRRASKRASKCRREVTVAREPDVERERRQVARMRQLDERTREAQLGQISVQRDAFDTAKDVGEVRT